MSQYTGVLLLLSFDADRCNCNRNRKLGTSTAPTKAKSREPAYSQALNQIKIDKQGVKIQRVRQADRQAAKVDGVWCSDGEVGREKCWIQDKLCQKAVFSVSSERPVER